MLSLKNVINKFSGQMRDNRDLSLLLSATVKKDKGFIYSHSDYELSWLEYLRFKYYLYLYGKNYPLAYILKHKEFYGLDFYINKNVLIPRPDTEVLVDAVIEKLPTINNPLLIDTGTGSGCIPIAILKKKNLPAMAIDISAKALRMAKKNARLNHTNIQFIQGNLLQPLLTNQQKIKKYNSLIITANLPYLTQKQYELGSSIQREPRQALVAGEFGLELYEKLIKQIKQLKTTNSIPFHIFLEIDPRQTSRVIELIHGFLNRSKIDIKPDLAGHNRIVCLDY